MAEVRASGRLSLLGSHEIRFDPDQDLILHRRRSLPFHPNGMIFSAYGATGREIAARTYYSVGGGFVVDESATGADRIKPDDTVVQYPFRTGAELLAHAEATGLRISDLVLANEQAWRSSADVQLGLLHIWQVMLDCMERGSTTDGVLPGGLKVKRRAADMRRGLESEVYATDPLRVMDWVTLFALAVNEENAAGGRVVTARGGLAVNVIEC